MGVARNDHMTSEKGQTEKNSARANVFPVCPRTLTLPDDVGTAHLCHEEIHTPQQRALLFDALAGTEEQLFFARVGDVLRPIDVERFSSFGLICELTADAPQ
jgi:hypothetical protein